MTHRAPWVALVIFCFSPWTLSALDPHRALTQYTRTIWTQAQGLPQDTVRSLAQTPDGYLWVGTKEGLARFDGYDFLTFTREHGDIPNDTVGKLVTASDGSLWIGTSSGLARYANGRFHRFTGKQDPAAGPVTSIAEDHRGIIWIACDGNLYYGGSGGFTMVSKQQIAPVGALQSVYEDRRHQIWIGGSRGLMRQNGSAFVKVLGAKDLGGSFITSFLETDEGLWAGGTRGIMLLRPDGTRRIYTTADGLPNNFVLAMKQDSAGSIWVGTYGGLSRLEHGRFVIFNSNNKDGRDWVWSLLEDREHNLWVGMNGGLNRFRDNLFSNYGVAEGMPSDDPYVVHQDKRGVVWVGYHDSGLVAINGSARRTWTTRDGLPSNEIFAIRDTKSGDLLVSTRKGLSLMRGAGFTNYKVVDDTGRTAVYDALEDRDGDIWAATARGIYKRVAGKWKAIVPESAGDAAYALVLAEGLDGSIWAATTNAGFWRIDAKGRPRLYTLRDGLNENQVRSLYQDPDGTLWIGTFGGGLNALRNGVFAHYELNDGLLSNNIAHIEDDGKGFLWLSTTRGITRVSKRELADFAAHKIAALHPENYGLDDGLRSAQCAPASPASGGGTRTRDGRLWFTTMHNLAIIDSANVAPRRRTELPTPIHILEVSADGRAMSLLGPGGRIDPGTRRLEFRFVGISLGAPERIRYSWRLEGLDMDWSPAVRRRVASYSPMPHGHYRFLVRASLPGGPESETSWSFEIVPHFYERAWFLWLAAVLAAAAVWAAYRARISRMQGRLRLVYEERVRLAREIHDTLAQGFVGISAQLDVLAMELGGDNARARQLLNLARKMAQHSLTEARRSVMNLRAGELETSDLSSVLTAAAQRWTAGTSIEVHVDVCDLSRRLSEDMEQNILRIAQEAVTNSVKHARASSVRIELRREKESVRLTVEDDGQGFEPPAAFSVFGGHFGILGMRERAEKLRARFLLDSSPGHGTNVEVTIPLALNEKRNI